MMINFKKSSLSLEKTFIFIFLLFNFLFVSENISAGAVRLKVGIIIPKGQSWTNGLENMAKELKKETGVLLKIYMGGTQGDEDTMLRKMRTGQLHGAFFTGKTLGSIYSDIRAIEVPFNFMGNRELAWKTVERNMPTYSEGFHKEGYKNLGVFEVGLVYLISNKEVKNLNGLKSLKVWSWTGDPLGKTFIDVMGLSPVTVGLQDVMQSLQTGLVDVAYNSPMGITNMQWKAKYLIDFPFAFSVGAFLLSNKAWEKIPANIRPQFEKIVAKHVKLTNASTIEGNQKALNFLKENGTEFLSFPQDNIEQGKEVRAKAILQFRKQKLFSDNAFQMIKVR